MSEKTSTATPLDIQKLKNIVPLNGLMDAHLGALIAESEVCYRFAGDSLFERGQFDRLDYFLLSGEIELEGADGSLSLLKSRDCLTAIGSAQPRTESARVVGDAQLLLVDRERLDELLDWSQSAEYLLVDLAGQRQRDEDAAWLETVLKSNLFLKVPPTNVEGIFECLAPLAVSAGDVILRQGELGDCCYFIKEGQAQVSREGHSGSELIATIGAGRCFGEDALIQQTVRNATVTMKSDGVLLVLQKRDFLPLLKPWLADGVSLEQQQTSGAVLLDVRAQDEYGEGHLRHAVNMPLHLLYVKHRLLNRDDCYVTYCETGRRSASACFFLSKLGYKVSVLDGGLNGVAASVLGEAMTGGEYILRDGEVVEVAS
ncbi:MAG: cyclic nucleotide-binding domain-containing protein [Cellvibrionaceae bacterium]